MSDNNIADATGGNVAVATLWNQFKLALAELIVPRNTSGVPTDEAGGLGNPSYRFGKSYIKDVTRNLTTVATGTVDISDTNKLVKTTASIANTNLQSTILQKDSFTFSLDEDSLVALFFESGLTATASGTSVMSDLLFTTSNAVVGNSVTSIYTSDYQVGLTRTMLESIVCRSSIWTAAEGAGGSSWWGGTDGGGVRMSKTAFFSAGTHTIYLLHSIDDGTVAAGDIDYTNCTYGAMRIV